MIIGDSLEAMPSMETASFDLVLADPPYGDFPLINRSIKEARRISKGASLYFMYADDIFDLEQRPDQVLFWTKPVSTKNTSRRYSRFVEVIACYDLIRSPFCQDTHWSTRTGLFTDSLVGKLRHEFEKPESLIEKLICVHTERGQSILDPFAGSGTVERVCQRLGRDCVSYEIKG